MTESNYGVLARNKILERMNSSIPAERLYITPILDPESQIGQSSIDITLGTHFVRFRQTSLPCIDPVSEDIRGKIGEYQERIYVKFGDKIFLHPKQFILGCTLEYVHLPSDLMAYVTGRSSWGRLGLVIATATAIHPNYTGVITLELANLGEAPIALYPGFRIAQLIFHQTSPSKLDKTSKYFMSLSPTFSKVYEGKEIQAIRSVVKLQKCADE
jgi:dCTP deaminase